MVHKLIVLSFTFSLLLIGNLVASDGMGWQPEPFESSAEEVFAAADGLDLDTEDAAAVVMFEEVYYRFDAEGRQSRTRTLATLYAQKDMPAEAYQIIVKAMDVFEEPQSVDWIVFGRMAKPMVFPRRHVRPTSVSLTARSKITSFPRRLWPDAGLPS